MASSFNKKQLDRPFLTVFSSFLLLIIIINPLTLTLTRGRSLDGVNRNTTHYHDDDFQVFFFHNNALPPSPMSSMSPSSSPMSSTSSSPLKSHNINDPTSPPPRSPPVVFDVRAFGAIGDGITDDSSAFNSAFDSACDSQSSQQEPNMLLVPPGYSFLISPTIFSGPCKNPGLVFQVEGTVIPPDGPDSWPRNASRRQWLIFYKVNGMLMQGGGIIDGRGQKWWNLPCKPHKGINGTTLPGPCDSPVAMRFLGSTNLTLRGIKVTNSPEFHIRFDNCRYVHVDSLRIDSPANSPNTDGIHVENTKEVTIYNSVVSNGDDCISIGTGSANIDIKNVTCGPSHGISIGSLGVHNSHACVSNVTVSDAVIKHSDNGVRIKTWQGGSGFVTRVNFNNIHMDTVRNPIIIDQYYCLTKNCTNQTSNVFITDVTYSNIHGTYDTRNGPIRIACSDWVPCTDLKLSNVDLIPADVAGKDIDLGREHGLIKPFCWNAYGTPNTNTNTTGSSGMVSVVPSMDYCLLEGAPVLSIPNDDSARC